MYVVGVVQSARCGDGQSQVLHPGQTVTDPAHQQPQQRQCTAVGVTGTHGRVADRGLGVACPQQFHAATPSSVLNAAFRVSAAAAASPATVSTSVGESTFYFHDGRGSYRTTPVAVAPMTTYYEKCAI